MSRQPTATLIHSTIVPDYQTANLPFWVKTGEDLLVYMAKVSNPKGADDPSPKLISYLIRHGHWSPFEMVSLCVEIECPRDIGRQILRHRSLHFQEFSQRYADASALGEPFYRECRLQHPANRQKSIPADPIKDRAVIWFWNKTQKMIWSLTRRLYTQALAWGVAKEVARAILPEGLTPSRLYLHGNLRDVMMFCHVRRELSGAQKEIVEIANQIREILAVSFPSVFEAMVAWENSLDERN